MDFEERWDGCTRRIRERREEILQEWVPQLFGTLCLACFPFQEVAITFSYCSSVQQLRTILAIRKKDVTQNPSGISHHPGYCRGKKASFSPMSKNTHRVSLWLRASFNDVSRWLGGYYIQLPFQRPNYLTGSFQLLRKTCRKWYSADYHYHHHRSQPTKPVGLFQCRNTHRVSLLLRACLHVGGR